MLIFKDVLRMFMSFATPIGPKSESSAPSFAEMLSSKAGRLAGYKRKQNEEDRFIPSRSAMKKAMTQETYSCSLPGTLFQKVLMSQIVPFYSEKTLLNREPKPFISTIVRPPRPLWEFPKAHSGALDLPGMIDDFYCHSLDWGKFFVGMNLDKSCYAYSFETKKRIHCLDSDSCLTSVKWSPNGTDLALGDKAATLSVYDAGKDKWNQFRNVTGFKICTLDWRTPSELTLGSVGLITHFDLRSGTAAWTVHTDIRNPVCSLTWNDRMLATGSNANNVRIFDIARIATGSCLFQYSHQAAVKALQWNPEKFSLLMSGGGSADRILKLFDTARGMQLSEGYVGSQICSMAWLDRNYFVLGLGYSTTDANLQYWRCLPHSMTMKKVDQVTSQEGRILDLAKDPDSSAFCTSSDNEALCFWEPKRLEKKKPESKKSIFVSPSLR